MLSTEFGFGVFRSPQNETVMLMLGVETWISQILHVLVNENYFYPSKGYYTSSGKAILSLYSNFNCMVFW